MKGLRDGGDGQARVIFEPRTKEAPRRIRIWGEIYGVPIDCPALISPATEYGQHGNHGASDIIANSVFFPFYVVRSYGPWTRLISP